MRMIGTLWGESLQKAFYKSIIKENIAPDRKFMLRWKSFQKRAAGGGGDSQFYFTTSEIV